MIPTGCAMVHPVGYSCKKTFEREKIMIQLVTSLCEMNFDIWIYYNELMFLTITISIR